MILLRGHAGIIQAEHVRLSVRLSKSMQKSGCLFDHEALFQCSVIWKLKY